MTNQYLLLNRFFTRNTLQQMIDEDNLHIFIATKKKYNIDSQLNNRNTITALYNILKKSYQNEYYFKNTLLNKLLLGVHSINTTIALTELPIAKSKADFVLINGKGVVYEIKTDLDKLDRLNSQIDNYYKAFSYVVVVTTENYYEQVIKKINNKNVGVYILTLRGTINKKRLPIEDRSNLSKDVMFKILRKNEYQKILIKHFGILPNVSQFKFYQSCKELFENLPLDVVFHDFIDQLKSRIKIDKKNFLNVPYELKFLIYFLNLKNYDYLKLTDFLNNEKGDDNVLSYL